MTRKATRRGAAAGIGIGTGLAILAPAAQAADIPVTTLADTSPAVTPGSLRAAMASANSNPGSDRIVFQSGLSGTISLAASLPTLSQSTDVVGPGADTITIDGNDHQGFAFDPPTLAESSISGLTIRDTKTNYGPAVYNVDATLTISGMVFRNNFATFIGGAVYMLTGSIDISNSRFAANEAASNGGAIYGKAGLMNISGSTFIGNESEGYNGGGAIFGVSSGFRGSVP